MEKSPSSEAIVPTDEFYNEMGQKYEDAFGHDTGLHNIVTQFLTLLPQTASVLDCGCGTGKPVAHMIAESGRQVFGIDLSQTMVELSRKQVPAGIFERCNMLEYAPPPSTARFGGVVAMLSLFALSRPELESMAQKFFRWIRPGGFLLLGTFGAEDCENTSPELYDKDGLCAGGIEFTFMNQKVTMTLFTKLGWNRLLEGVGFEIVHAETNRFVPPPDAGSDDETHYFVIARKPPAV